MIVTLITGSPHEKGTTSQMAQAFTKGVLDSGHEVRTFNAARLDIHDCCGCGSCEKGLPCPFKDDMGKILSSMLSSDAVVFASPVYFYNISGYLKKTVDRFLEKMEDLRGGKKTALMLTMGDDCLESARSGMTWMHYLSKFMKWDSRGVIAAINAYTVEDLQKTDALKRTYDLGRTLFS